MLTAINSKEDAYAILQKYGITPPAHVVYKNSLLGMPIQEFMGTQCYLDKNTLMPRWPHVDLLLDLMFYPQKYGYPHWFTKLYSAPKKSIKTAISSVVARWVPETWEGKQECIFLASDAEQAKGRGYAAFQDSVRGHPRYDPEKRLLSGPNGEQLWRITDKQAIYLPDGSFLKPVSSDYAGEAGGNPTATFYTELHTWRLTKDEKLYAEMTVPPTRPLGFRFIDTYAGYSGVSSVLWTIWRRLTKEGYQLTVDDVPEWGKLFPDEDYLPVYIHMPSRTIGYIDQGPIAHRFPWQQGEVGEVYYRQERAAALNESEYLRLHENLWADPYQSLMPIQWFDNCLDMEMPPEEAKKPCVISCDASVTHDCTAMTRHTRHPVIHQDTVIRDEAVWNPKIAGEINYDLTILPQLVLWHRKHIIVEVTYDKYQLKYLMDRVNHGTCGDIPMPDGSIAHLPALPVRPFNQQTERLESDTMLVTMIRDRKLHHAGNLPNLRNHILSAGAVHDSHENTKQRIVKLDDTSTIDLVVSASMGNREILRLGV